MGRNDIVRTDGFIDYDYLGESIDGLTSQMAEIVTVSITKYKSMVLNVGTADEDWTPALQAANDCISSNFDSGILLIPFNIQCKQTFNWDCAKVILKGIHTTATFNIDDLTKYAIKTNPSSYITENNLWCIGLNIVGVNRKCQGILLQHDTIGVCNLIFMGCNIKSFDTLVTGDKNSYLYNFIATNFYDTNQILKINNVTNSGERIAFTNCTLANSLNGIHCLNGNADIYIVNCSIDYLTNNIFDIEHGHIYFSSGHIEFRLSNFTPANKPFKLSNDGSIISIRDSYIGTTANLNPNNLDFLCDNNSSAGGKFVIENCYISWMPLLGFATGSGRTEINNITSNNAQMVIPKISSENNNLLMDGDFESDSILDDIRADSSLALAISGEEHYTGNQSMSIIKTQSGGARLNIYIPIKKLNIISWYFYVKNNVSNSAQIWLSYDFANIKDSNIQKMVEKGAIALNLSQPFDWKMISGNSLGFNIPKWATHFLIRINLDSTTTALKLYIDNLVCIEM